MTTKQAKKLHRLANKGPTLSKAEQRRIELMEQDRIRKEFESVKKLERARNLREKKKAKEDKEKEERRKKGLPMVDVHPSQDVISRFLFRKPPKLRDNPDTASDEEYGAAASGEQNREGRVISTEAEEEAIHKEIRTREPELEFPPEAQADELHCESQRRMKRPRLALTQNQNLLCHGRIVSTAVQSVMPKRAREIGAETYSRASSVDTDDPQTEILVHKQLLDDIALASSKSWAADTTVQSAAIQRSTPSLATLSPAGRPRPAPARKPTCSPPVCKSPIPPPVQQNEANMLPRNLHPPQRNPRPFLVCPNEDVDPPSSTQLFLLDHVDDLFPSPSQEAQELYETGLSVKAEPTLPCLFNSSGQAWLQPSPPKKRMFGSSGPGAEVLVAMERSYRQSCREQRALEKHTNIAQETQTAPRHNDSTTNDLGLLPEDLGLLDEFDDDPDIGINALDEDVATGPQHAACSTSDEPPRLGPNTKDPYTNTKAKPVPSDSAPPVASQDTDYGDFGADVSDSFLQLLDGDGGSTQVEDGPMEFTGTQVLRMIGDDTSWLDDDGLDDNT